MSGDRYVQPDSDYGPEQNRAAPLVVPLMLYGRPYVDGEYVRQFAQVVAALDGPGCDPVAIPAAASARAVLSALDDPANQVQAHATPEPPTLKGAGRYGEEPAAERPHPRDCGHPGGLVAQGDVAICPVCDLTVGLA